ncbi:response regulator transcription factor [Microterricola pindariensis]|uniref:Two-component system response regulator n=1 Tax=Microterricola pindariensis TaxID=478010 RepID=A0ABX5AY47_9MICO|nr:response regulator transcription factor [Microterricola pindariensis]PPL19388.1 two-component system response regulator [Microterricola pindariensis]
MSTFRVALVDDHEIVARGFADLFASTPGISVIALARTVDELLELLQRTAQPAPDLVILDLRLADGSTPALNVRRLREAGSAVLAFTGGDDASLVRSAAHSGVLGVIRKSEPTTVLLDAVRQAAVGETVASTEWAAALDGDPELSDAGLSARERQVLSLYAAGAKAPLVAATAGVTESTVIDYIRRIRSKYERVGRPASTKVDLYKRALEDGILPVPGGRRAQRPAVADGD